MLEGHLRPTSWAYHLTYWAEANRWPGRGGKTCTSVTKQSNGQTVTDRPSDPKGWYISTGYPAQKRPNPPQMSNSDDGDDSTRGTQSSGWNGWHECVRAGLRPADRLSPTGACHHDYPGRSGSAEVQLAASARCSGGSGLTPADPPNLQPGGERRQRPHLGLCPIATNVPFVLYIHPSPIVLLSGAIWQVLVQPSRPTGRIEPTYHVIQAIPTFGTLAGGSSLHGRGRPAATEHSSGSHGENDPDQWY